MVKVLNQSKALAYRRKAARCRELAACARSPADRARLLSMRASWLARAASSDWRDGLPPMPPANSNALSARG